MGNDGGVIAVKRKFMRHANVKTRGEKADVDALRLEKARTCALSSQPLQEPVVACRLGNLLNKQTVIEHLLAKSMPEHLAHISSLQDVVTCRLTRVKADEDVRGWGCPITMVEFTGKQAFVVLLKCGCVLSERALKAVATLECLVCSTPFTELDVVTLLDENGYNDKQLKLLALKAETKRTKKSKKKVKQVAEVDNKKKDEAALNRKIDQKSKRKREQLRDSKAVKMAKVASESVCKAKEKSQVFASLFSTNKDEKVSANDLLMTIGGMRYTLS
uniref:Replication termination factor 2 n=1 Tax=Peronospora matthiolae TaxID=2874970 RepID=A0AAV1UJP2_9STRA